MYDFKKKHSKLLSYRAKKSKVKHFFKHNFFIHFLSLFAVNQIKQIKQEEQNSKVCCMCRFVICKLLLRTCPLSIKSYLKENNSKIEEMILQLQSVKAYFLQHTPLHSLELQFQIIRFESNSMALESQAIAFNLIDSHLPYHIIA